MESERADPWERCFCGQRYIPSRTSDGTCQDHVRHAKLLRESGPKNVVRCSFCLAPLPEDSRKSRQFCNSNCRVKFHYATKGRGNKEADVNANAQKGG
jgi:hypothetical protein